MSKEATSADLIMKLYDLRREATMRDARNWFISYFPESVEDIMKTMIDPNAPASVRLRAAEAIFNHAAKAIEIEDVEARVAELERAAESSQGSR